MQNSKSFSLSTHPNIFDLLIFNKNQLGAIKKIFNCRREPIAVSVDLALLRELDDMTIKTLAEFYLTPLEIEKFTGFKFPKRKIEWLGGRIAAKTVASNFLQRDSESKSVWQDLQISPDAAGRPFCQIKGTSPENIPDISISHSGSFAVALAASHLCGIDIQEITGKITRVASRFATLEERKILGNIHLPETALFTILWSAKEAVRKAFPRQPLPGFMELCLESFTTGTNNFIGQFSCKRRDLPAKISFYCLQYKNYALALVIV